MNTNSGTHFYRVGLAPMYKIRLVTSKAEYDEVTESLGVEHPEPWDVLNSYAALYTFITDGHPTFVVGLNKARVEEEDFTGAELAALLVHEATHIKQKVMDEIGEDKPSMEFEAYAMQFISCSLFKQYAERL